MKLAKANDHWRRLGERKLPTPIKSFLGVNIPNLPTDAVAFAGPITVIAGLNGVGKTTLIHSAHLALSGSLSTTVEFASLKRCSGEIVCELVNQGSIVKCRTAFTSGKIQRDSQEMRLPVQWIDPASDVPALVRDFRFERNLDELLDQCSPQRADHKELESLSHLVGKHYQSSITFELEEFLGRKTAPYFLVNADGQEYGTESMGLGEAAIHYILWHLRRTQEGAIVIVEEPETYISARSQQFLMDHLAFVCLTKHASAIITTHSPHVFTKIDPSHTVILLREAGTLRVIVPPDQQTRLVAVGVPYSMENLGVMLVEDELAKVMVEIWMKGSMLEGFRGWHVMAVGGADQVLKCLESFSLLKGWIRAVGILDGDQRGNASVASSPLVYLPSTERPEALLRRAVLNNRQDVANQLGVEKDFLSVCLSYVHAVDDHDWLKELAQLLYSRKGVRRENLIEAAFEIWLSDEANQGVAAEAFDALKKAIEHFP